ncbi:MAG: hypothetical protein OEV93_05180 [Candidatus Moranbacteria bacterium]|nr:hypothetical protein [Candidatus Moranbacteria bacterium]
MLNINREDEGWSIERWQNGKEISKGIDFQDEKHPLLLGQGDVEKKECIFLAEAIKNALLQIKKGEIVTVYSYDNIRTMMPKRLKRFEIDFIEVRIGNVLEEKSVILQGEPRTIDSLSDRIAATLISYFDI